MQGIIHNTQSGLMVGVKSETGDYFLETYHLSPKSIMNVKAGDVVNFKLVTEQFEGKKAGLLINRFAEVTPTPRVRKTPVRVKRISKYS